MAHSLGLIHYVMQWIVMWTWHSLKKIKKYLFTFEISDTAQPVFTCLQLTMKTLEKSVKGRLSHRNQFIDLESKSMDWFLYDWRHSVSSLLTLKIFHTLL